MPSSVANKKTPGLEESFGPSISKLAGSPKLHGQPYTDEY